MTKIKFAKTRDGAIIPSKHEEDVGYDIYACFDEDYITIAPHETKLISTGIASACDKKYGFIIKERGSTGSKGIAVRAGVIEGSFRGEWFVALNNTTNETLFLVNPKKDKSSTPLYVPNNAFKYNCEKAIAQAVLLPVPKTDVEEITYEELKKIESERGNGMLGSSGK